MSYENPNFDTNIETEEEEILGVDIEVKEDEEKEEELGNILED